METNTSNVIIVAIIAIAAIKVIRTIVAYATIARCEQRKQQLLLEIMATGDKKLIDRALAIVNDVHTLPYEVEDESLEKQTM